VPLETSPFQNSPYLISPLKMNPKLTLLFLLGVATVLVVNGDGLNDVIDKASRGLEKTFVARDEVLKALKDKNLASIDRLSAAYNQSKDQLRELEIFDSHTRVYYLLRFRSE